MYGKKWVKEMMNWTISQLEEEFNEKKGKGSKTELVQRIRLKLITKSNLSQGNEIGGEHGFEIDTVGLLTEITDSALGKNMGVLKVPLNILMRYLQSVATRAAQMNDPVMNKIMCDMALYEVANPNSKEYDRSVINEVYKLAKEQRAEESN